jgi:ferredoxin
MELTPQQPEQPNASSCITCEICVSRCPRKALSFPTAQDVLILEQSG